MKNFIIGLSLGLAVLSVPLCQAGEVKESSLIFSIDSNQLPLKEILNEASRQTGWTIIVDERLISIPVTGSFQDIALESFLRRSLKGEALIVVYDEVAKSVDIRSFGTQRTMITISPNPDPGNPLDGKRIQALRLEEQRAYEAYRLNPDSIIEPLTGKTLGEVGALQAADEKAYNEYLANPNSVEPLTGMKLTDITALREKEAKDYQKYLSDPKSVEPLSGLKISEIITLRDKEQKTAAEENTSPDSGS
jgi:hypothetical protein